MHINKTFWLSVILLIGWVTTAAAQERIAGELLFMLKPKVTVEQVTSQLQQKLPDDAIKSVKVLSKDLNIWLLKTDELYTQQVLEALNGFPEVIVAQYNHLAQARSIPNDTAYAGLQWNLNNTGQSGGIAGADIDMEQAWDYTTGGVTTDGDTIVVAVIDQGLDRNHVDLDCWVNHGEIPGDSIDNDNNGYIDDYRGWHAGSETDSMIARVHGTHVAGIIGAKGNNITGVTGVNWNVKIMPVAVYVYSEDQVVAAYAYVYKQRLLYNQTNGIQGAFVVATNSSFGVDGGDPADFPLWCALYDSMGSVGILSVGATSNAGVDIDQVGDVPSLCSSNHLVMVTNTTRTDFLHPGSGYGAQSIDLGAPGTSITSTLPNNNFGASSGTSMAAPHVAGAIALMYALACNDLLAAVKARPDSMALEFKRILLQSTDTIPTIVGKCLSSGRLNVFKALRLLNNTYCVTCLEINDSTQNITCAGAADGMAVVDVLGGVPPYDITWSTGDSSLTLDNLQPGSYLVEITDSIGCERFKYITITEPASLQTGYTVERSINGEATGSISAVAAGGTPPYEFSWGATTGMVLDSLLPGKYMVTVTDANGCTKLDSVEVFVDSVATVWTQQVFAENAIKVYPNPINHQLHITWGQPLDNGVLQVTDITGRQLLHQQVDGDSHSFTFNTEALAAGVYVVHIQSGGRRIFQSKILKL